MTAHEIIDTVNSDGSITRRFYDAQARLIQKHTIPPRGATPMSKAEAKGRAISKATGGGGQLPRERRTKHRTRKGR